MVNLLKDLHSHVIHRMIWLMKVTLNRDDDKRIFRKDRISTFARGHKDLSGSPLLGVLSLIYNAKFFMLVKMPHSNFKERSQEFNTGVGKCPCGQTFEYTSERDMKMKLQMHCRFCSNPQTGDDKIGIPKKATTLREQQLNEAEKTRKVHN